MTQKDLWKGKFIRRSLRVLPGEINTDLPSGNVAKNVSTLLRLANHFLQ